MARLRSLRLSALTLSLLLFATTLFAADGRIGGRVTRSDGSPISGVVVQALGVGKASVTDAQGFFALDGIPAGTYTLNFSAGEHTASEPAVVVVGGETNRVDKVVDWRIGIAETITVTAVSRRAERIVEAPAAVTVASEEVIEAAAPSGQAPRIVENVPGVDFTQSGLYDFNFNARGFNSSLNRRILTLIDGRDPAVPFLGSQEWAALSYPIDEFASVELVRGPGSALYGANAFSGVLNMTTKLPRGSEGGHLMLTGGELSTKRADVRHAGRLAGEWYYRVVGGYQESDDFTVSRRDAVEYAGLARERVLLRENSDRISFGGIRLDKNFASGNLLTLEGGLADLSGPTFQTGIGRVQVTDVSHPWARINYNMPHWNFLGYYDARKANVQVALASGAELFEDSHNLNGELQTNWDFIGGRARVIGGVAYKTQEVDTSNPAGVHTLMAEAKSEDQESVFGQAEFDATSKLKLVAAARYDDSTLYEAQFSPKAAVVYSITPEQTVRYGYNRAFQRPNYSELFLRAPAAAPVNLSAIETAFRPALGSVSLGFSAIPVLALGNGQLDVEKVRSHELGYSGIFNGKLYVTLDVYKSYMEDFVTDLLPGVNPSFPAYQVPAGVSPAVAAQILGTLRNALPTTPLPLFVAMTNLPGGSPAFVISYTNAGKVETQGAEVAFNYYVTNNWLLEFNYSWFDFEVQQQALGDVLLPNSPESKYNLGIAYRGRSFDARLAYRSVDGFPWAAGVFRGNVPQYDTANLSGRYRINEMFDVGVDVTNLLNDKHWEAFGGDLLRRRALGFVTLRW